MLVYPSFTDSRAPSRVSEHSIRVYIVFYSLADILFFSLDMHCLLLQHAHYRTPSQVSNIWCALDPLLKLRGRILAERTVSPMFPPHTAPSWWSSHAPLIVLAWARRVFGRSWMVFAIRASTSLTLVLMVPSLFAVARYFGLMPSSSSASAGADSSGSACLSYRVNKALLPPQPQLAQQQQAGPIIMSTSGASPSLLRHRRGRGRGRSVSRGNNSLYTSAGHRMGDARGQTNSTNATAAVAYVPATADSIFEGNGSSRASGDGAASDQLIGSVRGSKGSSHSRSSRSRKQHSENPPAAAAAAASTSSTPQFEPQLQLVSDDGTTLPWAPYEVFLLAAFNVSLSFFLASFQVHEKTILFPLLPMMLLRHRIPAISLWFSIVAVWSMWPMLMRDGLGVPSVVLCAALVAATGHAQPQLGGDGGVSQFQFGGAGVAAPRSHKLQLDSVRSSVDVVDAAAVAQALASTSYIQRALSTVSRVFCTCAGQLRLSIAVMCTLSLLAITVPPPRSLPDLHPYLSASAVAAMLCVLLCGVTGPLLLRVSQLHSL